MNRVNKLSFTACRLERLSEVKFYKSKGYSVLYEFVTYLDRRMYRMIKPLSQ